jgi:hypothetical protein
MRPRHRRPLSATVLDPPSSVRRSSCHPRGSLAPSSKSLKRGREPPPSTSLEPHHHHRVRGSVTAAVFYQSRARLLPTREEMSSSSVPTVTQQVISSTPLSISAGAGLLVSANENRVYLFADLECLQI